MVMGLSVRLLGLSPATVLVPEALMGIAAVAVLMATVRRTFGAAASIIAGLVMALTPAAVLMFRYNNPDALLTLLLVGAAWAVVRGLETDRPILGDRRVGAVGLHALDGQRSSDVRLRLCGRFGGIAARPCP
jgi:4-amino-4-deoxy-L-arabinose transferase-like glycosyltransferase